MSRIAQTFEWLKKHNKKGLIPFVTAGFPTTDMTDPLLHAMVAAGADIIELGIPFSDPMADGPVIQRSSDQALANGMTLRKVLAMVQKFREQNQSTPIVLMGYANPIHHMGIELFAQLAQSAGVDGVLTVDSPPEESEFFSQTLQAHGIDPIYLIAPTTTDERVREISTQARGYVYYVSLKGVTGAGHLDVEAVNRRLPELKELVGLPVGVGFGIADAKTAQQIGQTADAVVIGSRLVQIIEETSFDDAPKAVFTFLKTIRDALDCP